MLAGFLLAVVYNMSGCFLRCAFAMPSLCLRYAFAVPSLKTGFLAGVEGWLISRIELVMASDKDMFEDIKFMI